MPVAVTVRNATSQDLPRLRDIERAAGAAFRDFAMDAVADDEPPTLEVLSGFEGDGRCCWPSTTPMCPWRMPSLMSWTVPPTSSGCLGPGCRWKISPHCRSASVVLHIVIQCRCG